MQLPRPSDEIEAETLRKTVRVKALCAKHGLELDTETEEIIRAILKGALVQGIGKLITRDWIICEELKFYDRVTRDSTKQRILEHLANMLGYTGSGSNKDNLFVDAVIGEIKEE